MEEFIQNCHHMHAFVSDCLHMPIVQMAKQYHKTLSVDTAWDETVKLADILPILEGCDMFFTNEAEACSIASVKDPRKAFKIISQHTKCLVLKTGGNGSVIRVDGNTITVPKAKVERIVDTTGAGDLYAAGYIFGMLQGWSLKKRRDSHRPAAAVP
jgi:sugar/nucleoside kinase (ribokinase family)